jgi:cytochrome c oxidase subunit 2
MIAIPRQPVRAFGLVAVFAVLLTGCEPSAQPDEAAVAAASGAYKSCAACHGVAGEGNQALNAPALVNLDGDYLARQLANFRDGKRGTAAGDVHGAVMAAQAASLTDADIEAIVAQVEGFDNVLPAATFEADIANGKDYYAMVCGACHGPDAVGNPRLNAPSLRGIDDWYLVRQYEAFRAGWRGSHPEDVPGQQMRRMGEILKDEEAVQNVSAYLRSLGLED